PSVVAPSTPMRKRFAFTVMSRAPLEKTYWSLMVAVMRAVKQCAVFVPTTTQTAGGESLHSRL
ncbi:hypothetical protein M2T59_31035, partial [Klebsiella pneumoniae]|uniref:hypothetical protein n=2 Tax=Klebsiella pneumoniae TaxID=573 RepID=UPI001C12C66E